MYSVSNNKNADVFKYRLEFVTDFAMIKIRRVISSAPKSESSFRRGNDLNHT